MLRSLMNFICREIVDNLFIYQIKTIWDFNMNVKKIPKQKTMEEASLSILKLTLVKYGVFLEKDPFEDTGIDLLVNVPTTKPIEIEDDRLKFLTVTDAFDRRLYGQLKSSQDGKFFLSSLKKLSISSIFLKTVLKVDLLLKSFIRKYFFILIQTSVIQ